MLSLPGQARFRSVATDDPAYPGDPPPGYPAGEDFSYGGYGSYSEATAPPTRIGYSSEGAPEPTTLRPSKRRWLTLITCLFGVVPFFGLAWAAVGLNGHKITPRMWDNLQTVMKVEVTLFPLVFAAIVGRMTRQLAHWRLQSGASVSSLQRLLGSNTVFGNIYSSWVLRSVSILGLELGLLWALSPLAAQSSLRVLSASFEETNSNIQLQYLNFSATADEKDISSWAWKNVLADEMFTAGLVTSKLTKGLSTDLWGNVKVPLLSSLLDSDTSTEWVNVTSKNVAYSSQIGLPVFGLLSNGSTSTTLSSSYIELNCQRPKNITFKAANVSYANAPTIRYIRQSGGKPIISWKSFGFDNGFTSMSKWVSASECSITAEDVEMEVDCYRSIKSSTKQGNCLAQKIRRDPSRKAQIPDVFLSNSSFNGFGQSIFNAMPPGHPGMATFLDTWMDDPYATFSLFANVTLTDLDAKTFSQRLTQMFNSFYIARLGYQFIARDSLNGLQSTKDNNVTTVHSSAGSAIFESSEGKGVNTDPQLTLHANAGWIFAFVLTTVVMIAAAFTTFFIGSATIIPDFLGFVSSLTRENPHVPVDDIAGVMGGVQRSRLLESIALRLGDVTPGDDLGTLAVGRVSSTVQSKPRREYR